MGRVAFVFKVSTPFKYSFRDLLWKIYNAISSFEKEDGTLFSIKDEKVSPYLVECLNKLYNKGKSDLEKAAQEIGIEKYMPTIDFKWYTHITEKIKLRCIEELTDIDMINIEHIINIKKEVVNKCTKGWIFDETEGCHKILETVYCNLKSIFDGKYRYKDMSHFQSWYHEEKYDDYTHANELCNYFNKTIYNNLQEEL